MSYFGWPKDALAKLFGSNDNPFTTKITDSNNVLLQLDPLVETIPTTGTFHHLGHEGQVFLHSERHNGIVGGAVEDVLIRIPAGNAARQVHLRFNSKGKSRTGILDANVSLYKDPTTTADGTTVGAIPSTNDANVKTTGVLMFDGPTVTAIGTFKGMASMLAENKSASNQEMSVPEFILAPNGASARDYILRVDNNGTGILDLLHNIFFYDSEAI